MKVSVSTTLPVDIDTAWDMLHTPAVFRRVSAPFTVFRNTPSNPLPERFSPDTDYSVSVLAGGLVPLGTQIIRLEDSVESWKTRSTVDVGRGASGMLSVLKNWRHQMSLEALPDGHTRFDDQLTVDAGWLTPLMWPALGIFWKWRAMRLRRLAQSVRSPLQDSWDARYRSKNQMWSGKVNPWVAEVADTMTPGRALDLGCGEGADVLWLAEKGWSARGVDASAVAIFRGHEEAENRLAASGGGLRLDWQVADLAVAELAREEFDLVSLQFFHVPQEMRNDLWRRAIEAVAPGGTLLIVGHSAADEKLGIPRPPASLLFTPSDLDQHRPEGWASWEARERQRVAEGPSGSMTVTDVVLVATR